MKIEEIIRAVAPVSVSGPVSGEINGIAYDSRQARTGCLFAALEGTRQNGRDFIADAISRGAVAVISSAGCAARPDVAHMVVADPRKALAEAAACFYGYPSRRMKLIGITGTNGKTTIAFLARDILAAAGMTPESASLPKTRSPTQEYSSSE